jgi:hypothetical protein
MVQRPITQDLWSPASFVTGQHAIGSRQAAAAECEPEERNNVADLNLRPLDEIGRYGTARMIADLLGSTRRDLAVHVRV